MTGNSSSSTSVSHTVGSAPGPPYAPMSPTEPSRSRGAPASSGPASRSGEYHDGQSWVALQPVPGSKRISGSANSASVADRPAKFPVAFSHHAVEAPYSAEPVSPSYTPIPPTLQPISVVSNVKSPYADTAAPRP